VQVLAAPLNENERGFALTPERKLLQRVGTTGLYWNGNAYPRDWIVHSAEFVSDEAAILDKLSQAPNLREVTFLLSSASSVTQPRPATLSTEESVEASRRFNSVRYRVKLSSDGYVVSSDAYYPGWTVKVDGQPEQLFPANVQMRAFLVRAGTHDIELRYVPTHFVAALVITSLAWLIVMFLIAWPLRAVLITR
jgi:hypothetical protein